MFTAKIFLYVKRDEKKQQGFIDYHLRCETHEDKSNSYVL
jgi:hypothetical protein